MIILVKGLKYKEEYMIPNKIKIGDTIGVIAPSNPIVGENIEEIESARKIVEEAGFKVKFIFKYTWV